jgi:hypothetical protein
MSEIDNEQPPVQLSPVEQKPKSELIYGLTPTSKILCQFGDGRLANYIDNDRLRQWINLSTGRKDIKFVCNGCLSQARKSRRDSKTASFEKYLSGLNKKVKEEKKNGVLLAESPSLLAPETSETED